MRLLGFLPLVLVVGCGDNHDDHHGQPDASVADAAVDAPAPLTCTYTEMADATNDDLFGPNTNVAEATGISFGTSTTLICGKLDNTHYETQPQRVDVDSYTFTVPAASNGLVYLVAPGAENFDSVILEIYGMTTSTSETGQFIGNFAVASAELPPGTYEITVSSYDATAPAAALDYKLYLMTDSPTRCAKATAAAAYTEALEGTAGGGNDVYEVRYSGQPRRQITALPTDVVEPTGVTVGATGSSRVTGINETFAVTPASWADSFQDRDTYQITMGAGVNQLSVRLNWPGTTADFDFFVFPMGGIIEQATGWYGGNMEDEYTTLSVIPGMSYWIFVGADDASTGQPITYDMTLCGATFTPPPTM